MGVSQDGGNSPCDQPESVRIDLVLASKYFKLAAVHNYAAAQFCYGQCLYQGKGVPIDHTLAAQYFKLQKVTAEKPIARRRSIGVAHMFSTSGKHRTLSKFDRILTMMGWVR
jgi:TPR repeat protein